MSYIHNTGYLTADEFGDSGNIPDWKWWFSCNL